MCQGGLFSKNTTHTGTPANQYPAPLTSKRDSVHVRVRQIYFSQLRVAWKSNKEPEAKCQDNKNLQKHNTIQTHSVYSG